MERLPLELWQKIFLFASTDGGCTASSISSLSTSFYHASTLTRYHSVALTGVDQVESFYDNVIADKPAPRVRHMYISLLKMPEPTDKEVKWDGLPPWDAYLKQCEEWEEDMRRWRNAVTNVVPRILEAVSPKLQTLTILLPAFNHPSPVILSNRFPALRELTYSGDDSLFACGESSDGSHQPLFPVMERLHVMLISIKVVDFDQCLRHFRQCAPSLHRLKISRMPGSSDVPLKMVLTVPRELPMDLGRETRSIHGAGSEDGAKPSCLLPAVQLVSTEQKAERTVQELEYALGDEDATVCETERPSYLDAEQEAKNAWFEMV